MSDVSNKANAKSSLEIGLYTGERTALMKKGLGSGFILGGTGLVHRGEPDAGDHQGRPRGINLSDLTLSRLRAAKGLSS